MKQQFEASRFSSKLRLHQHSPRPDCVKLSSGWGFVKSSIWPFRSSDPFVCLSPYVKVIDHGLVLQTIFGPIIYLLFAHRSSSIASVASFNRVTDNTRILLGAKESDWEAARLPFYQCIQKHQIVHTVNSSPNCGTCTIGTLLPFKVSDSPTSCLWLIIHVWHV